MQLLVLIVPAKCSVAFFSEYCLAGRNLAPVVLRLSARRRLHILVSNWIFRLIAEVVKHVRQCLEVHETMFKRHPCNFFRRLFQTLVYFGTAATHVALYLVYRWPVGRSIGRQMGGIGIDAGLEQGVELGIR